MTQYLRELKLFTALFALSVTLPLSGQPIPVEGTEMIKNEYGDLMPKEITWGKDGMPMVFIPAGSFTQGIKASPGLSPNMSPPRTVTLPSFYIDKYEVTNLQYKQFANEVAVPTPRQSGNAVLTNDDHPVSGIAWDYANQYAKWAGKELPTEAMWERAARGPQNTLYTTGTEVPDKETVIYGRPLNGETVPSGMNNGDVSGFGVFQMNGNVGEFCRDFYRRDAYKTGDATNPLVTEISEAKSYRGAHFATRDTVDLMLTQRHALSLGQISDYVGFRTVWLPTPLEEEELKPTPTPIPTISDTEIIDDLKKALLPFLEKEALTLPDDLIVNPKLLIGGVNNINFINFSPYRIYLTFLSAERGKVIKYREPLPPMSSRRIELPNNLNLKVFSFSEDSYNKGLVPLGEVRAESKATLLLNTELFGPVTTGTGERIFHEGGMDAPQFYDHFSPKWNEFEIYNTFSVPIVIRFDDIVRDRNAPEFVADFTVEPTETLRLTMPPRKYLVSAEYIGAIEKSSDPIEFQLDDKAARRMLQLKPDPNAKVIVITQQEPKIQIKKIEANLIAN